MLVVHAVEAMCPRLDDLGQNLGKWLHEAQETSKHRFLPFPNVANESGRCAPRDESVVATRKFREMAAREILCGALSC